MHSGQNDPHIGATVDNIMYRASSMEYCVQQYTRSSETKGVIRVITTSHHGWVITARISLRFLNIISHALAAGGSSERRNFMRRDDRNFMRRVAFPHAAGSRGRKLRYAG
jgi:hypothetical protein